MKTFDVLVHPTDFSESSEEAFQLACSIARDQYSELVVVHVVTPYCCPECESESDLERGDLLIVKESHEKFRRMRASAGDIPISFRLVFGYPVGMILIVACQENADLIVMASNQQSGSNRQIHGSVAEGVLRQAHCPVFCLQQPAVGSTQKDESPCMTSTAILEPCHNSA
ncbi:MAG: universal stress protein [Planctomycetes bacterium]|nr:universal stress protein [Planctomycetota bacterium]